MTRRMGCGQLQNQDSSKIHTIWKAIEDSCKEPFAFLAEELRVVVLGIGTSLLEIRIRDSKQTLPVGIAQRYVNMPE